MPLDRARFIFILSYCLQGVAAPFLSPCFLFAYSLRVFLCPRCALNQMPNSAADLLPWRLKFNQRTISRSVTSHNNSNNNNNCAVQWCNLWCMSEELMLRLSHTHTHLFAVLNIASKLVCPVQVELARALRETGVTAVGRILNELKYSIYVLYSQI